MHQVFRVDDHDDAWRHHHTGNWRVAEASVDDDNDDNDDDDDDDDYNNDNDDNNDYNDDSGDDYDDDNDYNNDDNNDDNDDNNDDNNDYNDDNNDYNDDNDDNNDDGNAAMHQVGSSTSKLLHEASGPCVYPVVHEASGPCVYPVVHKASGPPDAVSAVVSRRRPTLNLDGRPHDDCPQPLLPPVDRRLNENTYLGLLPFEGHNCQLEADNYDPLVTYYI